MNWSALEELTRGFDKRWRIDFRHCANVAGYELRIADTKTLAVVHRETIPYQKITHMEKSEVVGLLIDILKKVEKTSVGNCATCGAGLTAPQCEYCKVIASEKDVS